MSSIKLSYEPDMFDYPIDHDNQWHCIAAHFTRDELIVQCNKMQSFLENALLMRGFSHLDISVSRRDAAITLCTQRYGDWLFDNAGINGLDWIIGFSQALDQDVGTIRFATKDKAMLFKLAFDNQ